MQKSPVEKGIYSCPTSYEKIQAVDGGFEKQMIVVTTINAIWLMDRSQISKFQNR